MYKIVIHIYIYIYIYILYIYIYLAVHLLSSNSKLWGIRCILQLVDWCQLQESCWVSGFEAGPGRCVLSPTPEASEISATVRALRIRIGFGVYYTTYSIVIIRNPEIVQVVV